MSKLLRLLSLALLTSPWPFSPDTASGALMTVAGKTTAELFPWATFDSAIPTQEAVTGVVPGSRPLRHQEVLRYFEALAEASPRATLETYATCPRRETPRGDWQ